MSFRSSPSKARGKRTPRKNMKHGLKGARKNNTSSRLFNADDRSPGISEPELAEFSKVDDINSGERTIFVVIVLNWRVIIYPMHEFTFKGFFC